MRKTTLTKLTLGALLSVATVSANAQLQYYGPKMDLATAQRLQDRQNYIRSQTAYRQARGMGEFSGANVREMAYNNTARLNAANAQAARVISNIDTQAGRIGNSYNQFGGMVAPATTTGVGQYQTYQGQTDGQQQQQQAVQGNRRAVFIPTQQPQNRNYTNLDTRGYGIKDPMAMRTIQRIESGRGVPEKNNCKYMYRFPNTKVSVGDIKNGVLCAASKEELTQKLRAYKVIK